MRFISSFRLLNWLVFSLFAFNSHFAFAQTSLEALPHFKRVILFIFENANYEHALKQPYFAALAKRGVLLSDHHAITHPSQPNYLALIAGDFFGVSDDRPINLEGEHLGNLLNQHGLDWKVYAEDFPGSCFLREVQSKYVRKHVPFLSFLSVQEHASECKKIVNAVQLRSDLAQQHLPALSLYIPNLDHDGHDTNVSFASSWFEQNFDYIFKNDSFMKDTLVVITFDEAGVLSMNNQIYTVLLGSNSIPGSVLRTKTNHYSILKMIENEFRLGNLRKNDLSAPSIAGPFFKNN